MSGFIVAFYVGESGSLQAVRPARNPGGRGAALAARRAGRSGGVGQGGERQLSRRAHHPEQVPVQAAAAVLSWKRAGGRGEGGRRGREQRAARRQGDGLHYLRRVCRGGEDRGGAAAADPGGHGLQERGRIRAHLRDLGPRIARPRRPGAGETLLVLGAAGGVGLAAIEIGKALGARVIACASSDEKLAVCREHGADATINYAAEDLRERIKSLTGGQGADVIYDPAGGAYTEPAFRSIG